MRRWLVQAEVAPGWLLDHAGTTPRGIAMWVEDIRDAKLYATRMSAHFFCARSGPPSSGASEAVGWPLRPRTSTV